MNRRGFFGLFSGGALGVVAGKRVVADELPVPLTIVSDGNVSIANGHIPNEVFHVDNGPKIIFQQEGLSLIVEKGEGRSINLRMHDERKKQPEKKGS